MYTTKNFKTKKELQIAVKAWNVWRDQLPPRFQLGLDIICPDDTPHVQRPGTDDLPLRQWVAENNLPEPPMPVTLFAPGLGAPRYNGTESVEGPHYPQPHRWYASVDVVNGIVVKVR